MRPGQSAIPIVALLIHLLLHVVLLLISLVAMSDSNEDFIVGVPTLEDSSSDDAFVVGARGTVAPQRGGTLAPSRPASGGEESEESSGFVMGALALARRRKRQRTQGSTSGGFWALAASGDAGSAPGVGQQEAFAFVKISWALRPPPVLDGNPCMMGSLEYTVERSVLFDTPVAVAARPRLRIPCLHGAGFDGLRAVILGPGKWRNANFGGLLGFRKWCLPLYICLLERRGCKDKGRNRGCVQVDGSRA